MPPVRPGRPLGPVQGRELKGRAEPGQPRRPWQAPERETLDPRETREPCERPAKEPLWRDVVGDVLRRERLAQERTLKDVSEAARISMPYLSELERGRKEASSEVLAAAARALGLGLSDLLGLVQSELARLTPRPAGTAPTATAAALRLTSEHDLAPVRPTAPERPGAELRGSGTVYMLAAAA